MTIKMHVDAGTVEYRNAARRLHNVDDLPAMVTHGGDMHWYQDGVYAREGGKPHMVDASGVERWYRLSDGIHQEEQLHRDGDLPAWIEPNGDQIWFQFGKISRGGDKPSRVFANGTQVWHLDGRVGREGDKPAVVYADGTQEWHKNGNRHRGDDKPAVIGADGVEEYYRFGSRHREGDKPAIVRPDGSCSWFYHDRRYCPTLDKYDDAYLQRLLEDRAKKVRAIEAEIQRRGAAPDTLERAE